MWKGKFCRWKKYWKIIAQKTVERSLRDFTSTTLIFTLNFHMQGNFCLLFLPHWSANEKFFSILIPTNIIFYYFKNNWINHTQNWVTKLKLLLLTDKIQFFLTTSLISFHLLIIIKLISSTTSLLTSHWPHEVLLIALN